MTRGGTGLAQEQEEEKAPTNRLSKYAAPRADCPTCRRDLIAYAYGVCCPAPISHYVIVHVPAVSRGDVSYRNHPDYVPAPTDPDPPPLGVFSWRR
jgi:hypothetical protein